MSYAHAVPQTATIASACSVYPDGTRGNTPHNTRVPNTPLRRGHKHLIFGVYTYRFGRLSGLAPPVLAVAFSPDGKTVLTGGLDGTARLWEAVTGKPLSEPLLHESGIAIVPVAFSPTGRVALIIVGDVAQLWQLPLPGRTTQSGSSSGRRC